MYRTLKELLPVTPSVSGLEGPIREILAREIKSIPTRWETSFAKKREPAKIRAAYC